MGLSKFKILSAIMYDGLRKLKKMMECLKHNIKLLELSIASIKKYRLNRCI